MRGESSMAAFNTRFKKSSEVLRSVAAVLISCLVLQDAAFAAGPSATPSVTIPRELGAVREQENVHSDKLIINIQDAHAQLGAQESIARILDDLVKRYDLKLISLEGASDHVDTSLVSSFPDAGVRRKTGETLLKNGQISAGEFYSMVSEKRVSLYGVEDKTLYEGNLEAFRELAEKRPAVRTELKKLRSVVAALESVFYPEELRGFLEVKRRFHRSPKGFSDYWKECRRLADGLGLRFEDYPNLVQLNDILALESGIDFKKASQERDALIAELSRLLPKETLDELILLAADYRKEKVSDMRFYRSLLGMARGLSLSLHGYPNLDRYLGYLERYERVDFVGLLGELGRFEAILRKNLETTPYSQRLSRLSERAQLLTALLDVSLESADYEKYLRVNGGEPLASLRAELQELCRISGKTSFTRVDYAVLSGSLPAALRFYEYAAKRNQALLTITLKRMEKEHVRVAALITGGFHSEGIAKLLNNEQVSYLVVMPKFDDRSGERPYITILTQKPKEYEAMFKDSDLYIAPPVMMDTAAAGSRLASGVEPWKEILVRVLSAAYIKEGALTPQRKEEYLRAYKAQTKNSADRLLSPKALERILRTLEIERNGTGLTFTLYGEGLLFPPFDVFTVPVRGDQLGKIERTGKMEGLRLLSLSEAGLWSLIAAGFVLHWHLAPMALASYLLFKVLIIFDIVPAAPNALYCGNFGLIAIKMRTDKGLLPKRFRPLVRLMGMQTEIRGEQAGGGLMIGQKNETPYLIGKRTVNKKRDNLTKALDKRLSSRLKEAELKGFGPFDSVIKGIWHYRYGTSSAPAVIETHYHEWAPATRKPVWRFDGRKWSRGLENVHHVITHNGDFDGWNIFGEEVDNLTLGFWLERILGKKNGALGDSPKIAGMMDLLITQGMWDSSVRLAYQWAVAGSVEDAAAGRELFGIETRRGRAVPVHSKQANTAPSPKQLEEWAVHFEDAFEAVLKKNPENLEEALVAELLLRRMSLSMPQDRWESFVRFTVNFFLHNDPNHAVKFFLSRASGSFGLVIASTLDPERLVVAAKGQPITLGYNRKNRLAVYASEPAAVNSVLMSQDPESSYRLDLNSGSGEIALMGAEEVSIYSMTEGELNDADLLERWTPMHNNPYIHNFPVDSSKDPVKNDIAGIPGVLSRIRSDWNDPSSFNRQSSDYFEELLRETARRHQMRQTGLVSKKADVLITGIENSLWLGEQFAQDLGSAFPELNVQSISANKVIENPGELPIGPETIVLYISQSGQTFSSLQGAALLETFNKTSETFRHKGIRELFIMTGELDSLMGAAIGQKYQPDAPFNRRIFVNGSGRRTAEPSTVAAAAAEQTLTELFLRLARGLRESFPDQEPLGLVLTENDLDVLETRRNDFVDKAASYIVGTDARGLQISSPENKHFIESGKKWAGHATEGALAWFFSALYVVGSLVASAFTHATPMVSLVTLASGGAPLALPVLLAVLFVDAALYIWMPWFIVLAKRLLDGRKLAARRGKRTLVIGDVPHVHQPLEQFVSKLFSLSYGDASLDVHGANPQDHMLHRFGHRVVRGTLIWLGVPDGRRSNVLRRKANAVLMTGSQAKGVANMGASAEVAVIGADPGIAQKGFDDTILLHTDEKSSGPKADHSDLVEKLTESRFTSFQRLLGGYVYFWAMAKKTASLPFLQYEFWKSQSRTRIATTASPSGVAASEFNMEQAPWGDPHERRFSVVKKTEGARLAKHSLSPSALWVRSGIFIFTLAGLALNPFSKAFAATAKQVSGNSVTFTTNDATHGDWLWRIARQMLGKSASNQEVADRVKELAAQNGIADPNVISASHDYIYNAGSSGDALEAAKNMGFIPPAPAPAPAAPSVELPSFDIGDAISNLFTSFPNANIVLVVTLTAMVVALGGFFIWRAMKSRRANRILLEKTSRPEDGPPRMRTSASGPPPVRKSASAPLFGQPRFDDVVVGNPNGARLASAAGGPPPDKSLFKRSLYVPLDSRLRTGAKTTGNDEKFLVGVILPEGQSRSAFEQSFSGLMEHKTDRFRFLYAPQATPDVIAEWKTVGVSLVLDEPIDGDSSEDIRVALLHLLAKMDNSRFGSLGPLIERLAGTDFRPLNEEERKMLFDALPPVEKKSFIEGLSAAETISAALSQSVTAEGISAHALRFALTDPSYRVPLAPAPVTAAKTPKTLLTDLEVFKKDAAGLSYALRVKRLKNKLAGSYEFGLLVRDPSLKTCEDVLRLYPNAAIFPAHKMVFAPDALTMRDLRRTAPGIFSEDAAVILPEPGLLVPDTEVMDKKALLVALSPGADSAIGVLEAAALLAENESVKLKGLSRMADGSWWYLPPIVPLGYKLLIEALNGMKTVTRSA